MSPDGRALIDASQSAMLAVFPADEIFGAEADDLTGPGRHFYIARLRGQAVGCVAVIDHAGYGEVKRLFVAPDARGQGTAEALMARAAQDAAARGLPCLRLETGHALTAAVSLYQRLGFAERPVFGDYRDIPASLFMEMPLRPA